MRSPPIRRILLVWPEFETSFWGMQYSLHRVDRRAVMAPLALVTVAGMLPREKYEFRHLDLNYQPIGAADIEWADLGLLSGWGPQLRSILRVARLCRKAGRKVLIGGPLATECHALLDKIDYVFTGEAEGTDLDGLLDDIAQDRAPHLIKGSSQPAISDPVVIPRFDLLDLTRYWQVTIQFGRGCPFTCEFCDIIELYGRIQRTKTAEAMVGELELLHTLGYRGPLFFVDDNFYSNRKNIECILPELVRFQKKHDYPFYLHTEASINLAQNESMLGLMREAGFYSMFTGIETPDETALRETRKVQNLKLDLVDAIDVLQGHELYVQAGFIMGFDSDPHDIADILVDYIEATGITVAMTGLLLALPNTQLERRLLKEGRMLETAGIDQFAFPNFVTRAHPENLMSQFDQLVRECFGHDALMGRKQRQQSVLDGAPAAKRAIACQELDFYSEHLHLYSEKVIQDLERLRHSGRFDEYANAHDTYWRGRTENLTPASIRT